MDFYALLISSSYIVWRIRVQNTDHFILHCPKHFFMDRDTDVALKARSPFNGKKPKEILLWMGIEACKVQYITWGT